MNSTFAWFQRSAIPSLRLSPVLIGFSVPISVALDNVLLAMVLLVALPNARAVWRIAVHHPVARAAWLLFGMLVIGVFYGATPLGEGISMLGKYIDLAFIPVFMLLLAKPTHRLWAQNAFFAGMSLTLLLSYLVGAGLLPAQPWMSKHAKIDDPAVFHTPITQSSLMAFAVFLALLKLRESVAQRPVRRTDERQAGYFLRAYGTRAAWCAFALLGGVNVLFIVKGRTGYLILLALIAWFMVSTLQRSMRRVGKPLGWRHVGVVLLTMATLIMSAYHFSPRLHDRLGQVVSEYRAWQPNYGKDTSTGQRLDFYYNTLQIVQRQPLFGVGTGGFPEAFALQTQGTEVLKTRNPHNEYLMITAQTGVIGLAFLLYLFYTQWRCASRLDGPLEHDAALGLVLAYVVNCLFNSPLMDHSDGLFFAFMTAVLFANFKANKDG
jgi:O-antigen ligase